MIGRPAPSDIAEFQRYAWLRALMLVVATAIALGFRAMPSGAMPITRILSVAGAAGGGLVFLVLPVLLATARCRSGWRLTVTSAVGLLVAACVVATVNEPMDTAVNSGRS